MTTEPRQQEREYPYTVRRTDYKPAGERTPPWACACQRPDGRPLLRARRHTEPWQCTPPVDVAAYQIEHGVSNPRVARTLHWLEATFGGNHGGMVPRSGTTE